MHLHGFKWKDSVEQVTRINYYDKELIWIYMINMLMKWQKIMDLKNRDVINEIHLRLNKRMTISKIINLIHAFLV